MYHHLWSETRQTGYSVGVTVRLESALSALDLVKKMEGVKERRSSNHATKDHPEEITKNLHGKWSPQTRMDQTSWKKASKLGWLTSPEGKQYIDSHIFVICFDEGPTLQIDVR
ncbi:uncharacterized protein LOC141890330 isoform X3 [Acropora palmata]|uniref:uncharacterized protein LOC141890330 isoform X3 n=1 Tax=Acropora palmata TaxID=6131 RepID=UPI003DA01387